jgi:phosphoserine phosphatase
MKYSFTIISLLLSFCGPSQTKDEKQILTTILNSKKAIESIQGIEKSICEEEKCVFLAFWDFDGTIMKGDSSEGLYENGETIFQGMVEIGIKAGYSQKYKGQTGFVEFMKYYHETEKFDKQKAYYSIPKIFAGAKESDLLTLSTNHFEKIMKNYYFPSSVRIMTELKEAGIRSIVISASSSFIVQGSFGTLPLEPNSIHGVQVEVVDGIITEKEISPLTYSVGKREVLQQIVTKILEEKKADRVFVLAGFGNSYDTDGPFLEYIANQNLEAGSPIAVMINGGKSPDNYHGRFKEVSFDLKK